jgi:DNA-damage-inducible protein J
MAQAMVNFRMDEDLKTGMEQACRDMGMSMTTAFTIFATKVCKERRIPFEVTADPDPFYSEANIRRLKRAIADAKAGRLTEHELIEADDE